MHCYLFLQIVSFDQRADMFEIIGLIGPGYIESNFLAVLRQFVDRVNGSNDVFPLPDTFALGTLDLIANFLFGGR